MNENETTMSTVKEPGVIYADRVSNLVRLSALAVTGLVLISSSCFGGGEDDAQTPEDETTTSETLASPTTTLPTLTDPAPQPEPPQSATRTTQITTTTSILPEPLSPSPSPPTTQASDPSCPSRPDESANYPYEVQAGDTLWFLATCFGVSIDAIVEASSVENPNLIQPGDNLLIPPASN